MNRDAMIATIIGFTVGLVITGLILLSPNIAKQIPGFTLPTISFPNITLPSFFSFGKKPEPSVTPTPAPAALTIDAPLPDSIEPKSTTVVSGSARAGSTVVIGGPADEAVILATEQGKYAGQIILVEGKNDITVTMLSDNEQMTQTITVFYTSEEF